MIKNFLAYFAPSVVTLGLSLILIPITTSRLSPEDFGLFALFSVFGTLVTSLSSPGAAFFWASFYPKLPQEKRARFISTLAWFSIIAHIFWSAVFFVFFDRIYFLLKLQPSQYAGSSHFFFALALAGSIFQSIWVATQDFFIIEGKASCYARIVLTSSAVSFAATILGLFSFNLGVESLFYANIAAAITLSLGSVCFLSHDLLVFPDINWVRKFLFQSFFMTPGNGIESFATLAERTLLQRLFSLNLLGIHVHAQRYKVMLGTAVKALSRAAWPVSLKEARENNTDFSQTAACWQPVYLFLGITGLISAALSRELLALITHGKFVDSAPFVTASILVLTIQSSGKEANAILFTHGKGIFMSFLQGFSQVLLLAINFLLIPKFGIWGTVAASIFQALFLRIGWHLKARKIMQQAWNETPLILTSMLISVGCFLQISYSDDLPARLAACLSALLIYICLSWSTVKKMKHFFRNSLDKTQAN